MAIVQGAYAHLLSPGLAQLMIKASALSKTKSFTFVHDFEQDAVIVKCVDFDGNVTKMPFTKEMMEDFTAEQFLQTLLGMGDPEVTSPKMSIDLETKGNLTFDNKKLAKFAAMYGASPQKIADLLNDTKLPGGPDSDVNAMVAKPYTATKLLEAYEQHKYKQEQAWQEKIVAEKMKDLLKPATNSLAKELHVYDLGEGMLVPCEMVNELAHMFMDKPYFSKVEPYKTQYLNTPIDDPGYDKPAKAGVEALKKKIDDHYKQVADNLAMAAMPMIVVKSKGGKGVPPLSLDPMYPGKVMIVDDIVDVSPYLTDKSAWFLVDDKVLDFEFLPGEPKDFISKVAKKMSGNLQDKIYGKSMFDELAGYPAVTIPKKPKQITKESLAYFHKLLGGKKDPYLP